MAISTYDELKTAVANWLNRGDLTDRIPEFIALLEEQLTFDERVVIIETLTFDAAEEYALPSNFKALKSLYHDGPTYFGAIEIARPDELSQRKALHGDTGVPAYAAIIADVDGATLRFAPEPGSSTYSLRMVYEAELTPLADGTQTNELLPGHPAMYLYGTLVAAEPYILEDERAPLWQAQLEGALNRFAKSQKRKQWGGRMSMMPRRAIGSDV